MTKAVQLVAEQRETNVLKWGIQTHPDGTSKSQRKRRQADAAQKECDAAARSGKLTWLMILREEFAEAAAETDPDRLIAELTDVAAVAMKWIDSIKRRQEHQERETRSA